MSYINVGAIVDSNRPASKAALKRALTANPETVRFDVTSPLGPRASDYIRATVADIGSDKLSVCGPNPYHDRKWYGTVSVVNGKVKLT